MQGFFQHFMELSSGTFRLQVDHILAEGDFVVAAGSRLDDQGVVSPNRRKFRQAITDNISGSNRIESTI